MARMLGLGTVSLDDVAGGEVHRLLLASLCRSSEATGRLYADAVVLACCGTLLERLHGPLFVLAGALGASAASNALALLVHEPSVSSTSGGVAALGTLCALRYGRWAAVPGIPVPVAWVMAPILVASISALLAHPANVREYEDLVAARVEAGIEVADMSGLEVAVASAACDAILENVKASYQPPPADLVQWREELEVAAETAPPPPPDGAFLADVAGAALACAFVLLTRRGR
eukprot:NODE_15420_length_1051_cov_2.267316.p1 GENE.NODE_15420_length_1051_cov_2.267316~~NODE_15420_length_1051_cov_2.267316.p1  ORF type:complete len:232 (+),score=69.00 NODE_15420_length_1051_cov_2.267316:268-963(+)